MDPITTAILSWLTGEVGTAGVRIIGGLARGDRQQRALETIVARSVNTAVDEVVADSERADVREALLRELPQDADAVRPGDIFDLETAVSRVLGPRLGLLQEQGYRIDSTRLTNTLARLIRQGIQADADRGGPLAPLAEHIRHERLATASEAAAAASKAMAGDLRAIRRALVTAAKDRTIQDTGRERVGRPSRTCRVRWRSACIRQSAQEIPGCPCFRNTCRATMTRSCRQSWRQPTRQAG